jgi:hypothetical protein
VNGAIACRKNTPKVGLNFAAITIAMIIMLRAWDQCLHAILSVRSAEMRSGTIAIGPYALHHLDVGGIVA